MTVTMWRGLSSDTELDPGPGHVPVSRNLQQTWSKRYKLHLCNPNISGIYWTFPVHIWWCFTFYVMSEYHGFIYFLFIHFTAILELYSNISTLSQSEHHFPRVTDLNMSGLRWGRASQQFACLLNCRKACEAKIIASEFANQAEINTSLRDESQNKFPIWKKVKYDNFKKTYVSF